MAHRARWPLIALVVLLLAGGAAPLATQANQATQGTMPASGARTMLPPTLAHPVSTDPADVGAWSAPNPIPFRAVHSILLPTGRILTWADQANGGVFDPAQGTMDLHPLHGLDNIFCAGATLLPDGRVYVVGGSTAYENVGIKGTWWFDAWNETWWDGPEMNAGHYYGSAISLPDGRIMVAGGQDEHYLPTNVTEVLTPGEGEHWNVVPSPPLIPDDPDTFLTGAGYPRWMALPDGELVRVAPQNHTLFLDPTTFTYRDGPLPNFGLRTDGTALLLPGLDKVLLTGGRLIGTLPTTDTEILDLRDPTQARWREVEPMHVERAELNSLLLPDGKALVIGGAGADHLLGVLQPEVFDPATEHWTLLAPEVRGRTYHSTTLLLPDGRVYVAGGNLEYPNGGDPTKLNTVEIYSPPYLFHGPRPVIAEAPRHVGYGSGSAFDVTSPDAGDVQKVVLYRLGAATHSFDFDHHYVDLGFTTEGTAQGTQGTTQGTTQATTLHVQSPASSNVAPPGWYMLFLLNSAGVPSVASMVQVSP